MNVALKILTFGIGIALVACNVSTPSDIAKAADASNNQLVKAQEDEARVADAHAAASREINGAVFRLNLKQAKADYGEAIAAADRSLSNAIKKCSKAPARSLTACETDARSIRDQSAERAKVRLSLADQ